MGVDYYETLRVDRSASDDDIKKSYHKLAMKWHPDKNRSNMKDAEVNFKLISEAYDTLSDPEKRKIYDLCGKEGLKGQVPSPSAAGSGSRGRPFNKRSASDDIFSEIFGNSSPFRGMADGGGPHGGSRRRGMFGENIFATFGGGRGGTGDGNGTASSVPKKGPPVENTLACSLEELYKGSTRKLKISRTVFDSIGRTGVEEITLTIDIKAGWKKGTKILFPEKGNEERNQIPSDLVFFVDEKPHAVFKREGNDLVVTQKLTLLEALTGYTVQLTTLDGRNLTIPVDSIISPYCEEIVQGEGMPIAKEPSRKGNLRIRFEIKFPTKLTSEQKTGIKRALDS